MPKARSRQSSSPTQYKVAYFDCATRFLVESESRPDEVHLVDLDAENEHKCECSCEDFEYRNKDWINIVGSTMKFLPYECKHIKQVWLWLQQNHKKIDAWQSLPLVHNVISNPTTTMSQYIKPSSVKKYIKSHGKRTSKEFLEALDRYLEAKLLTAVREHNGGKKTLDSALAGYIFGNR